MPEKTIEGTIDAALEFQIGEVKQDDDGSSFGEIEGIAAAFGNVDLQDDIIERGAFRNFFKRVNSPSHRDWPKMLFSHNTREPIGVWDEMTEEKTGLKARGRLILDVQRAKEIHALAKARAVTGLSIGYKSERWEFDEKRKVRKLLDISLHEVSLVVFPANPRARVTRAKSLGEIDIACRAVSFWVAEEARERIDEWREKMDESTGADWAWLAEAPDVFDIVDDELVIVPGAVIVESEKSLMTPGSVDRELLDECWQVMGIEAPWLGSPASSFTKAKFVSPATRREMEHCLRDAGMTRRASKAMSSRWDGLRETREDDLDRVLEAIRSAKQEF